MRINNLKIKNFRNIENIEIEPGKFLNLFLGGNAQGKTSLLEAVFFASHLKSFRTNQIKELIQFDKEEIYISGNVSKKNKEDDLLVKMGLGTHQLELNKKNVSKPTFLGKVNTVVFSPDSLQAIKQGPEKRRDLLDNAASLIFKEALASQRTYSKIIKQKNAALKSLKNDDVPRSQILNVIESLNEILIPAAADVLFLRLKMSDELMPRMEKILSEVSGTQIALKLINRSKDQDWMERQYEEIKERISKEIKNESNRVIEEALGVSVGGPHRHDISFLFDGKDARSFCSQGQQRALILAFKIAQIVYHGEALESFPILLLDDVLSEFDENKRKYLLDFLQKNEAQTFLTATDADVAFKDVKIFGLNAGRLTS